MSEPDFLDQAWIDFDHLAPIPAEDERGWYQDLWPVRGMDDLSRRIAAQIARAQAARRQSRPPRLLLLGHTGSGKSTELGRIQRALEADGFRCLVIEAERDLAREDIALPDVQMLIVEHAVRLMQALDHTPPEPTLRRLRMWFADEETVEESSRKITFGLGAVIEWLTNLRADVQLDREKRTVLRNKVQKRLRAFIDLVADMLGEATGKLQVDGFKGLVVLVDGLEKASVGTDGRKRSVDMLLGQSSAQWAALGVPLVITAPLELLSETTRIEHHYDRPYLIPSIPVEARPDTQYATPPTYVTESIDLLRRLVDRRASVDRLFADPAALDRVIRYSGGSIRSLFRLLRLCIDIALMRGRAAIDDDAIDQAWKEHAISVRVIRKSTDLGRLSALRARPEQLDYDREGISLLQRELVLPYVNGGQWFGVHPAVVPDLEE